MWGVKGVKLNAFSKYLNKMPEVSSFEFFASQNIPQNIWFHSIFNIYERYTKSICRDIYVIRYQIYEDSVFTVHIFLRHLEISQMYLIHAPRDNFSHWVVQISNLVVIWKGQDTYFKWICILGVQVQYKQNGSLTKAVYTLFATSDP